MYNFIVRLIKGILRIVNGRIISINREFLPDDDTYILVAPHHSWLDPVVYLVDGFPKRYTSIAKEELRQYKIFDYLIDKLKIITVNRNNPGPSVIKEPVKMLKNENINVLIFPTGSRTKTDLKGGATAIARLSKKKMIPAAYIGPLTLKDVFLRKQMYVKYGEPIEVSSNKNENDKVMEDMQLAFDQMEAELTELASK